MPHKEIVSKYIEKLLTLKDLREAGDLLKTVPSNLLDDKGFAVACLTKFPETLELMSDRLRHDVDLSVFAINRHFCLGSAIFDDVDTVFDAMPEEMRTSKELNLKLIDADYWRPSLSFMYDQFANDEDILVALLRRNDASVLIGNGIQWSDIEDNKTDILRVLEERPDFFQYIASKELCLDKDFVLECLKVNGDIVSFLSSELYEKYDATNKGFSDLLAKTALESLRGNKLAILYEVRNDLSLAFLSNDFWNLAVEKSILCTILDSCPARFLSDKNLLVRGFHDSVVDFFTVKDRFSENDLLKEIVKEQKATQNDGFYISQMTNLLRGKGCNPNECDGFNDAINFMLNNMSLNALEELNFIAKNMFLTKTESEKLEFIGQSSQEDIKEKIADEISKQKIRLINKSDKEDIKNRVFSKPRKRLP